MQWKVCCTFPKQTPPPPPPPPKHEYRKILVQNYLMFYWVDEEKKAGDSGSCSVCETGLWSVVGVMEMGQLVEVTLEIDAELKEQAEKVLAENGLTLEEATILFFEETVRLEKLPFELDEALKQYIKEQSDTPASDRAGSVRL